MKLISRFALCLLLSSSALAIQAEPAADLREAVQRAVVTNPEVQAAWHAYLAAEAEQAGARGGYLPSVNLTAGIGREHQTDPGIANREYTRRGATLSLNQMVYDGFATQSDVARLDHARLTRYFELIDASEQTALATTQAYADVLRYRELVVLARDNFTAHKEVFDQIEARVRAGVGRRVDFEQAAGRLALAESNLLTEASNVHDVSARYQRIVGELPADTLAALGMLEGGIPANIAEALRMAYTANPAFQAAIENVRAAKEEARGTKSAFHPRVDLRARRSVDYNTDGVRGLHGDSVVELVFNYNLFNGGRDKAQVRQYAERLNVARDLRDKSCRDLRQTLAIAYNDVGRLEEQLGYLNQHQLSIGKAREAYRRQFDIGQRTLLDLLDTENEYFQARRAFVIADYDQRSARARALAGVGKLLTALKVAREDLPELDGENQRSDENDPAGVCPAEAPPSSAVLKATMTDESAARAADRDAPTVDPVLTALQAATAGWANAWERKDGAAYFDFYSDRFTPEQASSRADWIALRKTQLNKPGAILIEVSDLEVQKMGPDVAATVFRQSYRASDYQDVVTKRLEWARENGTWRITRETVQ